MTKLVQTTALKQTMKLTMDMRQRLNILQMSSLELNEFAAKELDKNPFLEEKEINEDRPIERKSDNYRVGSHSNQDFDFLSNISKERTLNDYILEQINIEISDPIERAVAYYLLDCLKPGGYVDFEIEEAIKSLKCSKKLIESTLHKLQTFDPPGIFARNLKECLSLQLKLQGELTKKLSTMLDNIELLANKELKKLAKICDVDMETITEMIAKIKRLNPKPSNGFNVEQTMFKIADVILSIENDNFIKLEMNYDNIPQLQLNNELYHKIKRHKVNKDGKVFATQELNAANNVIKSIEQRTKTILRVAACITQEQEDFFLKGVMYFKPLTLNKIAAMTGLNKSTISRATANKYIATPIGIYEFKYFFSSSLPSGKVAHADVSSTKVKEIIKQIILTEDSQNPLSDEEISIMLKKFNINAARRTVAKYRESLDIPTSFVRKHKSNH